VKVRGTGSIGFSYSRHQACTPASFDEKFRCPQSKWAQQKGTIMATLEITAEPGVTQIAVTRKFNVSRDVLFRAYMDPDLLVQWLGSRHIDVIIDHFDPSHGGRWRYVGRDADGNEYAFYGVFHGTPSPDRIVRTFEFEGMPGHVCLETITFRERRGTTVLTQTTVFQSAEDYVGVFASDKAEDIEESLERLGQLLARLVPAA
jgi:uncharacterized protein YndB with AHSA1/START domain